MEVGIVGRAGLVVEAAGTPSAVGYEEEPEEEQ